MISTVKLVQTIQDIFARMGVDQIQQNHHTHAMSGIHQFLQFLGCPYSS